MLWKREPALFYGFVNSVLALVLAFGVSLTTEQIGAILAVTSTGLALITRRQVNHANVPVPPSPEDIGPGGVGPKAVVPPEVP
jgi:hypothetical protein